MAKKNVELKMETLRRIRAIIDECGGVKKIKPNQLRNNKQYISIHKNFMNGFERRISDEVIGYIYDGKTDDEIQLIYKELRDNIVDDMADEKSEKIVDEMEQATEEMFVMSKNKVVDGPIIIDTTLESEDVSSKPNKKVLVESEIMIDLKNTCDEINKNAEAELASVKKLIKKIEAGISNDEDEHVDISDKIASVSEKIFKIITTKAEANFVAIGNAWDKKIDTAMVGVKTRKEAFDAFEKLFVKMPKKADSISAVGEFIESLVFDVDTNKNEKKVIKKLISAVKENMALEISEMREKFNNVISDAKDEISECETFAEFKDAIEDIDFSGIIGSRSTSEDFFNIMLNIHKKALVKSVGIDEAERLLDGGVDWFRVQSLIKNGKFNPIGFATERISSLFDMFFDRDETEPDDEIEVDDEIVNIIDDEDDEDDEPVHNYSDVFPMKGNRRKVTA